METLSVITITLNEERNISRCLGSVRWADEIVVVDSFSSDGTMESARGFTDKVFQHRYQGSTRQMELGIREATGDWILFLDADEEVSEPLADEIRGMLASGTPYAAFEILRKPQAFGRWIEHGGWFPDYQLRLLRRKDAVAMHAEVHGGFSVSGPRGRMSGPVYHYTYDTIHAYLERMNDYTSLELSNRLARNPEARASWYNLFLSPVAHFLRRFISLKGYRDGFHGFVLALLDGTYALVLYAKLWEYRMRLQEGKGHLPPMTNEDLHAMRRIR
jgi:glycosyltransferase involved in cell wall biosynthesis